MQRLKRRQYSKLCGWVIDTLIQRKCKHAVDLLFANSASFDVDSVRYGTERQTGMALKKSGVPRDEIFLATKIWMNSHHPDDVEACLDSSLERLRTEYVDLLMMHYPVAFAR